MALQLTVDSLDAVDEAARPLYVKNEDGKFILPVDIPKDDSERDRLTAKASIAEKEAIKSRKQLDAWKAIGKTPDEISALLKSIEDAEIKKAEEAGDHKKILQQHMEKSAKREAELLAELNTIAASERNTFISERVTGGLAKDGATEEGLDLLPERLSARIKFESKDGKRILKIMQADGETPMAGNGNEGGATIDDLVKEAKQKWPSLFKGTGTSGSGMRPTPNGGAPATTTKRSQMNRTERAAFVDANGVEAYNALPW